MRDLDITPHQAGGRPGYRVTFFHPLKGERITRSLSTRDRSKAKALCLQLEALCAEERFWSGDERPTDLDERAELIFYGNLLVKGYFPKDKPGQHTKYEKKIVAELEDAKALNRELVVKLAQENAKARALEEENAVLEDENRSYRKRLNLHCTATLTEAQEGFESYYKGDRDAATYKPVLRSLRLMAALAEAHGKTNLADIDNRLLDQLVRDYKKPDGKNPEPRTRQRIRENLSVFFSWAAREYDLAVNPVERMHPIAGKSDEEIVAIDREEDLLTLINSLAPQPYWQAWVAFACLAGPRWGSQEILKKKDIFLREGYARIISPKTGKVRNVPLERTTLMPILVGWLDAHPGGDYVFPRLSKHRTKNLWRPTTGRWNSNSNFRKAWKAARRLLAHHYADHKATLQTKKEYFAVKPAQTPWRYGPAEWRHTFGTTCGNCGFSALQISQWMNNSEEVCRRHYIGRLGAKTWGFRFD